MEVLETSVGELGRGDHACLVCASDAERWRLSSDYVRRGLEAGERTVYVAAEHHERDARRMLETEGAGGGELEVVAAATAHGYAAGEFDYERQLEVWATRAHAAVADGFTGLRIVVDMTWVGDVELTLDDLVAYERKVTELVSELPASALCVYDRRRFHPHTLARGAYAHAFCLGRAAARSVVLDSRHLSVSTAGPGALALAGEVDVSNADMLAGVLTTALVDNDALLLDMGALTFIDIAGLRVLHSASRQLGNGNLVLVSPPAMVRRMLPVLGIDTALSIDEGAW